MNMNDFLYKLCGKTELKLTQKAIEKMSLPELMQIMRAEQDGKIYVTITQLKEV